MTELDPRLTSDSEIQPSSGFVGSVMEAVREAAVEPAPLPFPWQRFAVGLVLCVAIIAMTIAAMLWAPLSLVQNPAFDALVSAVQFTSLGLVCALVTLRVTRLFASS